MREREHYQTSRQTGLRAVGRRIFLVCLGLSSAQRWVRGLMLTAAIYSIQIKEKNCYTFIYRASLCKSNAFWSQFVRPPICLSNVLFIKPCVCANANACADYKSSLRVRCCDRPVVKRACVLLRL